jgi:hypothetical protein
MTEVPISQLEGGCHCGAVRYLAAGQPYHATLCHCTDCRRTAGAPAVAWFTVRADGFRITRGEPRSYRSSAAATRTFCPVCGTALTYRRDGLDEVDITIASLDRPEAVPPEDHTFARSRLHWMDGLASLPHHATLRPPER